MPCSLVVGQRVGAWFAAVLVGLAAPLAAQWSLVQSADEPVAFVTRDWHSGNGLPQNTVNAIVQARDGRLWMATLGGLCSFDGDRLLVFDPVSAPALRSSRFTSLCEAMDGTLWIGSDIGGLFHHRDGVFVHHPEVAGANVVAIAEAGDGRLFVATDVGTQMRHGGGFVPVDDERLRRLKMLQRGRSGAVYGSDGHQLLRLDADGPVPLAVGDVRCVAEVGGHLVVGTGSGLHRLVDGTLRPWRPAPGLDQSVLTLCEARDGALWIGTWMRTHRVGRSLVASGLDADPRDPAPITPAHAMQSTRSLCEDREGGMWAGYTEGGATRFRAADVMAHGLASGLPKRNLAAASGDGTGGLLVTTMDGLFRKVAARFVREPALDPFLPLRTLLVDPDGTQWIVGATGLVRRDRDGCAVVGPCSVWPTNRVVALTRAPDGALWLGGDGLARFDGREVVVPPVAEAFRQRSVRTIVFAPDGAMWLGCTDGLVRVDLTSGAQRQWRSGAELPFGQVRSVLPEVGECAWIATYGGGVVRVDGARTAPIDERHGVHDQHLCGIAAHGDAFVLASNRGLCVVRRADLTAVADGLATSLSCRVLGMPGGGPAEMHGGYQGCIAAANGRLWFVGIEALYEFDPEHLAPPERDLPTHVHEVIVGDRRQPGADEIDLPLGVRSLIVRLGTCAFDQGTRVRFRWRLSGVRDAWSEPTYDREVRLVDLPPGDPVFEASTVDADGAPAGSTLRMHLHVGRLWSEAAWVRPLGLGVAAAFALLLVRFGARRAAARAGRLQALVDERTRELVGAQQHLEQRVADRTAELRDALVRQEAAQLEQQRLERQLQRMQRMESLGQLAGGIAHDFNNLLTVVRGASELLVDEPSPTERAELCRSIEQASERGRNLTQHLLAVASRQHVATEHIDLVRVVEDLRPVLQSLLGDSVTLHLRVAESAPVRAAVTQIEQILLNLGANARDAMPRGGEVTIAVAVVGSGVQLSVRDTGCGMAPDVVERAFEPFFSTKGAGSARGLGLATVYGIAKQLAGEARIDSAPGAGTTVTVHLPRDAVPSAAVVVPSPEPSAAPARLQSRVLLIEDEDAVRATLQRLLAQLGCTVQAAASGDAALALLQAAPAAFDVVLSDVVMPGLHGRRLLDALRQVRPELPILFVSGYLDGRVTHRDLVDAGLEILAKPIVRERLAAALQRALHGGAPVSAPPAAR
ncbi:MAG: two-component regulator propeller domain-containing protein [Planctomycetota bacterium]